LFPFDLGVFVKDPTLLTRLVVKHRGVDLIQFHPRQIWQELQVTTENWQSEYVRHLRYIELEYERLEQVCAHFVFNEYFCRFDKVQLHG
jgi:hypothetical protein